MMTQVERILSAHSSGEVLSPGQIVVADVDLIMAQDGTAPLAMQSFTQFADIIPYPERVAFVIDHNAPSPSEGISELHRQMREFCREHGVRLFSEGQGVCHQLMVEHGLVGLGKLAVGADSHSCTYGAVGALGTGVGSTDLAAAMATGKLWFRVPATINVVLKGELTGGSSAKDVALQMIKVLGSDGANYAAIEFTGDAIAGLSLDEKMTISNMVVEAGAKAGLFPDGGKPADESRYADQITIDCSSVKPQCAVPHAVENVVCVDEVDADISIGFIGTCTNGRYSDFEKAADILAGKKIATGRRLYIAPASKLILKQMAETGVLSVLLDAGACLLTPGCGPCVGTHAGIPANGEVVLSTANRNFRGRMGNDGAEIYLASAQTVASSMITGTITSPGRYL